MKTYNYIYLITNNLDNKIYVGKHSTNNLNDGYLGSGKHLKRAIRKYGKVHFSKKILAYADTEKKLNWFERYYIKKYNSTDLSIGYNIAHGGEGSCGNLGKPMSEEQKKKISEARKGEKRGPFSEEHRKHLSEAHKGKHKKGHPHSEETRKKMSETRKGRPTWNKGKHHSEETKRKISESLKKK